MPLNNCFGIPPRDTRCPCCGELTSDFWYGQVYPGEFWPRQCYECKGEVRYYWRTKTAVPTPPDPQQVLDLFPEEKTGHA